MDSKVELLARVAQKTKTTVDDLLLMSTRGTRKIAEARQIAYYVIWAYGRRSASDVAKTFGRDSTSVLYGIRKVEKTECLRMIAEQILREHQDAISLRIPGSQNVLVPSRLR